MTTKNKGGKPVEIDYSLVEKLAELGCIDEEIAAWCGVSRRTITRLKATEEYQEAVARGEAKGKTKLRRLQWKIAMSGNPTMAIYLGKVILGQKEASVVEHKFSREELISTIEQELEDLSRTREVSQDRVKH